MECRALTILFDRQFGTSPHDEWHPKEYLHIPAVNECLASKQSLVSRDVFILLSFTTIVIQNLIQDFFMMYKLISARVASCKLYSGRCKQRPLSKCSMIYGWSLFNPNSCLQHFMTCKHIIHYWPGCKLPNLRAVYQLFQLSYQFDVLLACSCLQPLESIFFPISHEHALHFAHQSRQSSDSRFHASGCAEPPPSAGLTLPTNSI